MPKDSKKTKKTVKKVTVKKTAPKKVVKKPVTKKAVKTTKVVKSVKPRTGSVLDLIEVVKETKDYLVLNKPAGLIVHADGKTKDPTLVDWLAKEYPETKKVGETMKLGDGTIIERPGIVHRLDRDTTGIIVVARNQQMFDLLKKQFQDKTIEKHYRAFVYGYMKTDHDGAETERIIDMPIARSKNDFRRWTAERGKRGDERDAITIFKPITKLQAKSEIENKKTGGKTVVYEPITFIDAFPKTGRTHQIRVHAKAINSPIVSDALYAPQKPQLLGFKRQALHARSISFLDLKNTQVKYEAEYPADFKAAFKEVNLDSDLVA